MRNKRSGICARCGRKLLVCPESGLCLPCENESLKENVRRLELALAQCRREKQELYLKLSGERARNVGEI